MFWCPCFLQCEYRLLTHRQTDLKDHYDRTAPYSLCFCAYCAEYITFFTNQCCRQTKQQKLAQNIRKLKQAHADLDTLYRRLAGKEISDHRKESFGRKWTRALRDIDKYTGKVRRYGGSPSAPSRSYMSWEIMAKKVSWQSQASEAAEKRDEAKKKLKHTKQSLTSI